MRILQVCPLCKGTLQLNFHPLEKQIFVADATMMIVMLSAAMLFESTVLLVIAIVVTTLPYLYLQWVLPDRLGSWRRYNYGVQSPNRTIEEDAHKNGARRER